MSDTQQYKLSVCRMIGTIGSISLISLAIIAGGAQGFLNLPATLLTFVLAAFLLLGSFGIDFLKFVPASLMCLVANPQKANPCFVQIATFGSRYVIAGAVIFALIINVQMLMNLSDPSTIGCGMATSLLSPLYAIIASELFFSAVRKAFADPDRHDATPLPKLHLLFPVVAIGYILLRFFAVILAVTAMDTY